MQVWALLATTREGLDARSVQFNMPLGNLFFDRPLVMGTD